MRRPGKDRTKFKNRRSPATVPPGPGVPWPFMPNADRFADGSVFGFCSVRPRKSPNAFLPPVVSYTSQNSQVGHVLVSLHVQDGNKDAARDGNKDAASIDAARRNRYQL